MTIQEQFDKFYENIKLTPSQRKDAIKKYTGVCKKLHEHYYPDIEYNGNTKLLIGSYGKQTHIRPARDIDVIFIMPPEKFEQYDDNESNGQSQLLQDIKKILEEKYPDTLIKASGKVVVLEFADTQHNVELLPAWENQDSTFTIPNSEDGGYWEQWDPRAEIQRIKDSETETGKTKTLIRMAKKWSENCSVKLKSYQIEDKALDFLGWYDYNNKDYSILVRDFFEYFYNSSTDEGSKSHLKTAYDRATKACDFENERNFDKATEEWKKIFGDDFPSSESENTESTKETKSALADYSHCEGLRWPYNQTGKVRIDAYVYTSNDDVKQRRKLGGINSDGRNLAPEFCLRFISQTNAKGNFKHYWQVVNTGQAAKLANDLRGNIFEGFQTRWEDTKYPGKHWIECFIVQDGICITRSGKFFVNIR